MEDKQLKHKLAEEYDPIKVGWVDGECVYAVSSIILRTISLN